jgi:hypothetical protein
MVCGSYGVGKTGLAVRRNRRGGVRAELLQQKRPLQACRHLFEVCGSQHEVRANGAVRPSAATPVSPTSGDGPNVSGNDGARLLQLTDTALPRPSTQRAAGNGAFCGAACPCTGTTVGDSCATRAPTATTPNPNGLNYFAGTASHNTIQFDDRDQMPRVSRFLFGDWLKPDVIELVGRRAECAICCRL